MSRPDRRLQRFIDAVLRDRKPNRGAAGDDLGAMRLAASLHAAHPGSSDPSPEFTDDLARTLRQAANRPAEPVIQRRRFLVGAGLATAAAAGVGAGFGIEHMREALSEPGQPTITPNDAEWVAVAKAADMKLGTVQRFSANGIEGFLLNTGGKLSALSAVCTDQGCILNPGNGTLNCPCHYAQFGLDGMPKPGGYHKVTPLPVIQVRSDGETVEALLPKWS